MGGDAAAPSRNGPPRDSRSSPGGHRSGRSDSKASGSGSGSGNPAMGGVSAGGVGEAGRMEDSAGTSSYVSQAIIRRLAKARRRKSWRAVLKQLDAIEEETAEIRGRRSGRGGGGGRFPTSAAAEDWRVWCANGLSREDGVRARTTVYNMAMDVLGARKRYVRFLACASISAFEAFGDFNSIVFVS